MDLSIIIRDWPYDDRHEGNNVRKLVGVDGRMKVQVRILDGVIQWDVDGRPDGRRLHGCDSMLAYCRGLLAAHGSDGHPLDPGAAVLDGDVVAELADEFRAYCRRGRALLLLGDSDRALRDCVHALAILNLMHVAEVEESLLAIHDRYRPTLLVDRARAEMLRSIREGNARAALDALTRGIADIERFYRECGADEHVGDSTERQILVDLRRSLREKYNVPLDDRELLRSLRVEQEIAIRTENYEMAARLRDKIKLVRHRIGPGQ